MIQFLWYRKQTMFQHNASLYKSYAKKIYVQFWMFCGKRVNFKALHLAMLSLKTRHCLHSSVPPNFTSAKSVQKLLRKYVFHETSCQHTRRNCRRFSGNFSCHEPYEPFLRFSQLSISCELFSEFFVHDSVGVSNSWKNLQVMQNCESIDFFTCFCFCLQVHETWVKFLCVPELNEAGELRSLCHGDQSNERTGT